MKGRKRDEEEDLSKTEARDNMMIDEPDYQYDDNMYEKK